jgi:hypothetical protein
VTTVILYTLLLYQSLIKSITFDLSVLWIGVKINTVAAVAMVQMAIACERVVLVVVERFVNKLDL